MLPTALQVRGGQLGVGRRSLEFRRRGLHCGGGAVAAGVASPGPRLQQLQRLWHMEGICTRWQKQASASGATLVEVFLRERGVRGVAVAGHEMAVYRLHDRRPGPATGSTMSMCHYWILSIILAHLPLHLRQRPWT